MYKNHEYEVTDAAGPSGRGLGLDTSVLEPMYAALALNSTAELRRGLDGKISHV